MFHTPEVKIIGFNYLEASKLEEMQRCLAML